MSLARTLVGTALAIATAMAQAPSTVRSEIGAAARPAPNQAAPAGPVSPLTLKELLDSVNQNYPPLLAALQDKPLAEADVVSAMGRFDLVLRASANIDELGPTYSDRLYGASVEQATQFNGISYFSGYRVSRGTLAPYEGKDETNAGGEYRAGVRVPLFRDRAIDSRRAELYKARIGRRLADLSIDQQRIVVTQAATRRYWDWVAAGRRFDVAQSILNIALDREAFLKEAVDRGALPAVEIIDNQRLVLQRRGFLVEARRTLEQASIELSLFLRDQGGDPVLVSPDRLPKAFPAPQEISDRRLLDDIDAALQRRPEIARLVAQRDQLDIDKKLAINQQYPGVDALFSYARQVGDKVTKRGPDELRWTLSFDLPLQRRQAIGREQATVARMAQIDQRTRFQRDQVAAEVRDAVSAVRAAFERAQVVGSEVGVTKQVENAERDRLELGDSSVFNLNLREIATVDAQVREIASLADYYRALALYELAIAQALAPKSNQP